MGTQNGTYRNTVGVTISNDEIDLTNVAAASRPVYLTLEGSSGAWVFHDVDNSLYLAQTASSKNQLNGATSSDANTAKWTIVISSGTTTITNVQNSSRTIQYNSNSGQERFSTYTSTQKAVCLYVEKTASGSSDPEPSDLDDSIYRIRDAVGYLCVNTDGTISKTTDPTDMGTLFTAVRQSDDTYLIHAQGRAIASADASGNIVLSENASISLTHGTNNEYISVGNDKYVNADVVAGDVGAEWTFEEVGTNDANLPSVTLNQPSGDTKYYRTFFADFPFTPSNGTAYTVSASGGMAATTALSGTVPARTAVLIVSDETPIDIVPQSGGISLDAVSNNQLVGTCQPVATSSMSGTVYVFSQKNGVTGFYRYSGATLAANKAYLLFSGSGAPQAFALSFDTATGINELEISDEDVCFDLTGRRVLKPRTGVYIRNGRKVLVK